MIKGQCFCGSVGYEADCEPGPIVHCHCQTCRKIHGSAFSSVMPVQKEAFAWKGDKEARASVESSPGKHRSFCSRCGSHVAAEREDADVMLLRMGCVDTEVEAKALGHIWRSDCASWYDPKTILPEKPVGF